MELRSDVLWVVVGLAVVALAMNTYVFVVLWQLIVELRLLLLRLRSEAIAQRPLVWPGVGQRRDLGELHDN